MEESVQVNHTRTVLIVQNEFGIQLQSVIFLTRRPRVTNEERGVSDHSESLLKFLPN